MSFFDWFSGKSSRPRIAPPDSRRPSSARDKASASPHHASPAGAHHDSGVKLKRHARREQLYVAIRESMTRAGVLSSRYKFKVLSLDPRGNEFLVMMDVAEMPAGQSGSVETLIIQHAQTRFEITVPAVYWRVESAAFTSAVTGDRRARPARPLPAGAGAATAARPPRYEPIQADEVTAFQQALQAASASGPASTARPGVQTQSGPRSPALLTGFENTEMPDVSGSPVLSSTQYGDL